MKKTFATVLDSIDQPLIDLFTHETDVQIALREATKCDVEHHHMMSTPEQAQFLAFLAQMISARRAIEIGVFTGYGTLAIAQALPEDGQLIACDHNETWPLIGKPYWERAGVAHKIALQIAPAVETLQALLDEGGAGNFDFIFVDADKIHYADYLEFAVQLLRVGGLLVFDNVLRINQQCVVKQEVPATRAVAALMQSISDDVRFTSTLVPIAQGMLVAKKC